MANEKQTKAAAKTENRLHAIVEHSISVCIQTANELQVTGDEFKGIYPMQTGFVLVYYR